MEADEVLNKIRESKRALIIRLAKATGFEHPPEVSEKDVEVSKERQQLQSLSKELEEVEAALKEASQKREKKELELRNIKESIENKTKITEEELEGLRKAEEEYIDALKKEKSIIEVVQKKKDILEEYSVEEKALHLSEELEELEVALKNAELEKEQKKQESQNLKETIKSKTEITEEDLLHLKTLKVEYTNARKKEKG
ncbi:MAG: hypothetical protein Q8N79_09920, partial [Candidatus Methanoperedens sp.]|nr:hypothetical protein [Candidatus Methanoperedens sp.]